MRLVTVHLPAEYLSDLDELVRQQRYPNRSETIRVAIRDLLREELWRSNQPQLQSYNILHNYNLSLYLSGLFTFSNIGIAFSNDHSEIITLKFVYLVYHPFVTYF